MASAAEQLAANINLASFAKATELKKRIGFTLLALIVYRLGTYIPLPGIDPVIMGKIFSQKSGGILDMFNMFSGGALQRMTIFALNIMPYVSASIIVQLMSSVVPSLEVMKKEGDAGRKKLNQYTRYLTVLLAAVQAYGLSVGLESMGKGSPSGSAVIDPGIFFQVSTIITLIGGTLFLMWLGEQITARGIGNGISLIIFSGIVAGLPRALLTALDLSRTGALSSVFIVGVLVLVVAIITFIVFIERAQRKVLIQYPKRQVGNKVYGGESTHLPLKLNTTGVIPPIFASSLLLLPLTLVGFLGTNKTGILGQISNELGHGKPLYMILYAALIIFFVFFYTAVVFNPTETAENLRKAGGFIPGIRPGKSTADYLDYVITRISVLGAGYLVLVCLFPEFLVSHFSLPFYFGGTSLLIAVTVTMDTVAQVHSYLLAHQYEGLLKKSKLRGQRGAVRQRRV
jgi:preprotein translocase subunit SecY